jgi:hypothetical protein
METLKSKITLQSIKEEIESFFDIELDSNVRSRKLTYPRSIYYSICRKHTPHSLQQIGESIGKNHATVINGLNSTINEIPYEPYYNLFYKDLDRKLCGLETVEQENKRLVEENESLKLKVAGLKEIILKDLRDGIFR